jgi:hypothetical protein
MRQLADVARGQAFEAFSLRRFVRDHQRLYENLAAGKPAEEGSAQPAVAGHTAGPLFPSGPPP